MATTTNYGWTTPDNTDLVKDGALAIRTLGTAVDSTVFANAGAAIAKAIVDAKGDIIAATAADTVARLAVGANNTVLTADSSTATGLKWASAGGGSINSANSTFATSQDTTSSTYTDLSTTQSVTLTTGTKVMVIVSAKMRQNTLGYGAAASYEISGATSRSASDEWAVYNDEYARVPSSFSMSYVSYQSVTAGSNTFTLKFKSFFSGGGQTASFSNRQITVIDLGS